MVYPFRGYLSAEYSQHANAGFASWEYGNTGGFHPSPAADVELGFVVGMLIPSHGAALQTSDSRGAGWGSSNCKHSSSKQMLVLN